MLKWFIIGAFIISVIFLFKYINEFAKTKKQISDNKIAKEFIIQRVNKQIKQTVNFTDFARHEANVSNVLKNF